MGYFAGGCRKTHAKPAAFVMLHILWHDAYFPASVLQDSTVPAEKMDIV
jgi:hypothetical protein